MSDIVYSHAGVVIGVSATPQNDDLDASEFSLISYTPIANVGMLGEYGVKTMLITYDLMDENITRKAKGTTNAGDPDLELARADDDPGQLIMQVLGHPDYDDCHAFRVVKQDGSIDYLRGLVVGPVSPNGRHEDFDLHKYVLGLVQLPVHAVPISGDWILETGDWDDFAVWLDPAVWID